MQYTATGSYDKPTVDDRYRMIRAYFQMLLNEVEATQGLPRDGRLGEPSGKMKQFATWFTDGVPGGAKLRAAIYQARTGEEVLAQVEIFFGSQIAGEHDPALKAEDDQEQVYPDGALVCD